MSMDSSIRKRCTGELSVPSTAWVMVMPVELFVCWLLNVPATGECISGTDLHRQFYVLPH